MDSKKNLIIDFLNVGFGECIVVRHIGQSPYTIVIDGGDDRLSIYNKNPDRIQLLTYLQNERISKIDLLIMTHPHRDHVGGLKEVVKSLEISEAWYTFSIPSKNIAISNQGINNNMIDALEIYKFILMHLNIKGTKLKLLSQDYTHLLGEMNIEVFSGIKENINDVQNYINLLYNTDEVTRQQELLSKIDKNLNACSLVLSIQFFKVKILLTSDILLSYWNSIINKGKLRADILKLPHHGDRNHLSKELLNWVWPSNIVICADNENTYGLPSKEINEFVKKTLPHANILYSAGKENSIVDYYRGVRCIIDSDGKIENTIL